MSPMMTRVRARANIELYQKHSPHPWIEGRFHILHVPSSHTCRVYQGAIGHAYFDAAL